MLKKEAFFIGFNERQTSFRAVLVIMTPEFRAVDGITLF